MQESGFKKRFRSKAFGHFQTKTLLLDTLDQFFNFVVLVIKKIFGFEHLSSKLHLDERLMITTIIFEWLKYREPSHTKSLTYTIWKA